MILRTFLAAIVLMATTLWLFAAPYAGADIVGGIILPVVLVALVIGAFLVRSATRLGGGFLPKLFLSIAMAALLALVFIPAQVQEFVINPVLSGYAVVDLWTIGPTALSLYVIGIAVIFAVIAYGLTVMRLSIIHLYGVRPATEADLAPAGHVEEQPSAAPAEPAPAPEEPAQVAEPSKRRGVLRRIGNVIYTRYGDKKAA